MPVHSGPSANANVHLPENIQQGIQKQARQQCAHTKHHISCRGAALNSK